MTLFIFLSGFTYFIKGRSYYKFDDNSIRRVAGPRDFGADFMKCTAYRRFSRGAASKSVNAQLATVLIPSILTLVLSLL